MNSEHLRVAKIMKAGNGLAIVIPRAVLRGLKWERGDVVTIGVFTNGQIAVRKLSPEELRALTPNFIQYE